IRKLNLERETPDLASVLEDKIVVDVKETSELMTVQLAHRNEMVALALVKALTDSYMDYVDTEKTARGARDAELEKAIADQQNEIKKKRNNIREAAKRFKDNVPMDPEVIKRKREEFTENARTLKQQLSSAKTEIAKVDGGLKTQDFRLKVLNEAK